MTDKVEEEKEAGPSAPQGKSKGSYMGSCKEHIGMEMI